MLNEVKMGDISKHFSRCEFSCKCGCGFTTVDVELLKVIEELRVYFQNRITITSGCRCSSHNIRSGGSKNSKHMEGIAADFKIERVHSDAVYYYLIKQYKNKYGIGRYKGRTHLDIRSNATRWDCT